MQNLRSRRTDVAESVVGMHMQYRRAYHQRNQADKPPLHHAGRLRRFFIGGCRVQTVLAISHEMLSPNNNAKSRKAS